MTGNVAGQHAGAGYIVTLDDSIHHAVVIMTPGVALQMDFHNSRPAPLLQESGQARGSFRMQRRAQKFFEFVTDQLSIRSAQNFGGSAVYGS